MTEKEMVSVYISLGSNIGDKKNNLLSAVQLLKEHGEISVKEISPFYKTEPVDYLDQDWFVNGVLMAETSLRPTGLMKALKNIEKTLKQGKKAVRFGPRIIDLDIIYYGDTIMDTDTLIIPHPRMHRRCFVLKPLCDMEKSIVHPVLKLWPNELLERLLKRSDNKENQKVILINEEE